MSRTEPAPAQLSSKFAQWALPKLRALVHARNRDAQSGSDQPVNFLRLLSFFMSDFELEPFAKPDFVDNLNVAGDVCFTAAALRQGAENFLRANSVPHRMAQLMSIASGAHGKPYGASLLDTFTAPDLWALSEQPRLHELTCIELGIPTTTPVAEAPRNFGIKRQEVIEHEFAMLSESDQAAWHRLAHERKEAVARGDTDVAAVQEMQSTISSWMLSTIDDKLSGMPVGDMVILWSGFYTGPQDNTLRHFKGQAATYTPCERWFDSPAYHEHVEQAWLAFMDNHVEGDIVTKLEGLPCDVCPDRLPAFREELKSFLENIFMVSCRLDDMNNDAFWALVESRPHEFVAPHRLPRGVTLADPTKMEEQEFVALYEHVFQCFSNRKSVASLSRFCYEPGIINRYTSLNDAFRLKAQLDEKRGVASVAQTSDRDILPAVVGYASGFADILPARAIAAAAAATAATDTPLDAVPHVADDSAPIVGLAAPADVAPILAALDAAVDAAIDVAPIPAIVTDVPDDALTATVPDVVLAGAPDVASIATPDVTLLAVPSIVSVLAPAYAAPDASLAATDAGIVFPLAVSLTSVQHNIALEFPTSPIETFAPNITTSIVVAEANAATGSGITQAAPSAASDEKCDQRGLSDLAQQAAKVPGNTCTHDSTVRPASGCADV